MPYYGGMSDRPNAFVIHGGTILAGDVVLRGSKNAASKAMVASLLTEDACVIENIPFSEETAITRELCERIGSAVSFEDDHICRMTTPRIREHSVPELSRRNRIPILAIGPLLARGGVAEVPFLGGDPIGHRPIDFHLEALTRMGATIERREHSYHASASRLTGADIVLPFPSVGATESVLLTAVLAHGRTTVENAAVEPEVQNLIAMLQGMGAVISADAAAKRLEIEGVAALHGVRHRVISDRNEAVSFAVAALATGGNILLRGADAAHLAAFVAILEQMGGRVTEEKGGLLFAPAERWARIAVETAPHPGFMTDWQQPLAVLLTRAAGTSILHETVYEDRLGYLRDMGRMGARVDVSDECPEGRPCRFAGRSFNHVARITGPTALHGIDLAITDIRAGMAHVIAALSATGTSVISGIAHLDRGYEKLDERLRGLGADITRV